jgi:ABC-type transporter Mla subunit MlaD
MTQPEALRLADDLQEQAVWESLYGPSHLRDLLPEAATELRRLHDHTQMLEHAYKSACDIVEEQDKKLVDLEAVNQELLEALKRIADPRNIHFAGDAQVVARAAIARAEGEQT